MQEFLMNNYFLVATLLVTSVALYAGCGSCPSACSSTKSACESKDECKKPTKSCTAESCDTKEEATEEEAE